jgi:peptide/nickel transport system substrate-binding protein
MLDPNLDCLTRVAYFNETKVTPKVVDKYTLEITTDAPSPILPVLMSTMVGMSPKSSPMGEYTREPIGTGPYRLSEWTPGQRIVLERSPDYWGEQPAVARATYLSRSESAVRAAMVASGEADIAPIISPQDATDSATDFSYLNSETTKLRIDLQKPPLDDVRIRRALNMAIDREAMLGTIYSAESVPTAQFVMPTINGHNPNLQPFPYDPAQAKVLVEEARADGVPVDTEILLVTTDYGHPGIIEASTAMTEMMRSVGLNVRMQIVEKLDFYKFYFKPYPDNQPANLLFESHDNNTGDAAFTVYTKYHSDGGMSKVEDEIIDELIVRARGAENPERREAFQEIFRRVHEDIVSDVMLFHMVGYTRVNPRLDFKPTTATNNELQLSQIKFR